MKEKSRTPILDADHADHYLVKLSEINSNVDIGYVSGSKQGTLIFKDLEPVNTMNNEELERLKEKYEKFYILTYNIDNASRMLSEIDLWMPEVQENNRVEMFKVDSLTGYLNNTGADINREAISELTTLPEEELSGTPAEFDYKALEKDEKENG